MHSLKVKYFLVLLILFSFVPDVFAFSFFDNFETGLQNLNIINTRHQQIKDGNKAVNNIKRILPKSNKKTYKTVGNKAPATYEEYLNISKDVKRSDFKIPEPVYEKDSKIIDLPDPHIRISKYNLPPGSKEINLTGLYAKRKADSIGVLSPDYSKMVYSTAFYYPTENQVTSEMYLLKVDKSLSVQEKIKTANEIFKEKTPIISTGLDDLQTKAFKTLVLVDWSKDGKKIAVKEKVGSTLAGIWKTNLLVYDFDKEQTKELNEIREAIRYWWKTNENLDLIDYMWDIYPVGWDAVNPDRIIVYAYAYTKSNPKFLGTWSIDSKGERSELMSLKSTDFAISTNGVILKVVAKD